MNAINLQDVGSANAKPAGEFKIGEKMLWNYGVENEVVAVEKETAHTITFTIKGSDGHLYSRQLKKSRLVGVASE